MASHSLPLRARRALRRLSTFRARWCIVYRHERHAEVSTPAEIREVTAAQVEDARAMDDAPRIEEFRRFLARGDRGYYGYLDGVVVHRSWLVHGPATMRLWRAYGAWPVRAGEAYIHYCETSERARGKGIYPAALSLIAREAKARGVTGLFITTEAGNLASRRGIEKAGFAECARVRVLVFFGVGSQRVVQAKAS